MPEEVSPSSVFVLPSDVSEIVELVFIRLKVVAVEVFRMVGVASQALPVGILHHHVQPGSHTFRTLVESEKVNRHKTPASGIYLWDPRAP